IQPIKDNVKYKNIGNRYTGGPDLPYRYYIWNDDGNYTDGMDKDANNPNNDPIPYIVEYATDYVDDSFLPSKGGDTTVSHAADIARECNASDSNIKWTTDFEEAMKGPIGITKVRIRLKSGVSVPPGSGMYFWINHKIREVDLATNQPMNNGDLIVNYAAHKFNYGDWSYPSYIPGTYPGNHSGWNGDRVIYSGPKVRIKKDESRATASPGDEVTYTLHMSYTDDIGSEGHSGEVKVVDILPKDFKYVQGSIAPSEEFGEPTIGTCADADDINSTTSPCVDGKNQVLIWDLGTRDVNAPGIPDLNYTVVIGAAAKNGTNTNVVKIESPTDASPISQRKADIGLSIDVPSSINIVKSTIENPNYPSPRERTTTSKEINFLMDMRNGKDGNLTELDAIDILPFVGDGEKVIHYNNIMVNRKVPTHFHGTMKFKSADFGQSSNSETTCDYSGKIKYYYTNENPKNINIAPNVSDENKLDNAKSIWCEGDENGPNGCTITSKNFTFTDNSEVTAVRVKGATMEKQSICQFKVNIEVKDNLAGDNYSNSTGASAIGVTLPVLSNSLAVPVVGSSLGDRVWLDTNKNGIQDDGERGVAGVTVHLLDASGNPVKDPANPSQDYVVTTDANGNYEFVKLNSGDYKVKFDIPTGYAITSKDAGDNDSKDSDADTNGEITKTLGVDEHDKDEDLGLTTPNISGNIFDDGDGNTNVNGDAIAKPDGTPLYVTLLDEQGNVLATKPVNDDGTYEFTGNDGVRANKNYKVVVSKEQNATASTLPDGWNNTGEKENNSGNGKDGTVDGIVEVHVATADVPNNDFGINKKPSAQDKSKPSELNPGGTTKVSVPELKKDDKEDGNNTKPKKLKVTQLPTNGKLYYDGNLLSAGDIIDNYDPSKLEVDPDDGDQTVVFKYSVFDNDGQESDSATVTMPFTGVELSGHIFDDGNGDGSVNGSSISKPDGKQLYATLLDKDGKVLASKPIDANGEYKFTGADGVTANTKYSVVLTTTKDSATPSLPDTWNNADGEQPNNSGAGNDGQTNGAGDGKLTLTTSTTETTNPNNDFGINKAPTAVDKNATAQLNPGNDKQVQVPTLEVSDTEDGTPNTITIKDLPNNAKLYYNGKEVTKGQKITDYDPKKLTVDPDNGDQTVVFHYTTTDKAGVESDPATVTMPFVNVQLSGTIYDDGNGDNNINGKPINKPDSKQLYATLLDKDGKVLASKPIAADGSYKFETADGVEANEEYKIVLSTSKDSKTPSLPATWNNADGEKSLNDKTNGNDGAADGI
ncbi:MAG: hypothetical protein DSY76_00220, partial [Bacteroidetes bacterium]